MILLLFKGFQVPQKYEIVKKNTSFRVLRLKIQRRKKKDLILGILDSVDGLDGLEGLDEVGQIGLNEMDWMNLERLGRVEYL